MIKKFGGGKMRDHFECFSWKLLILYFHFLSWTSNRMQEQLFNDQYLMEQIYGYLRVGE